MPRILQREADAIAGQIADDYCSKGPLLRERALREWRRKLQQEPTSLAPSQVDQIMREVQVRLKSPELIANR